MKSSDESTFGRLISEEYNVYLKSYFEALWYNRFYSDAEEPIWATLSFDYDLSAAASSNSALASAYSRASDRALGPDGTAVVSDEDAAELSLFRSVSASSGGPVSSAISGSYVFDVLFRPGDYAEFNHFFAVEGGLEFDYRPHPASSWSPAPGGLPGDPRGGIKAPRIVSTATSAAARGAAGQRAASSGGAWRSRGGGGIRHVNPFGP